MACVFCGIVAGEQPATFLAREDRAVAFLDVQPATRGHLLVVPVTHTADLLSADPGDLTACTLLAQRLAVVVRDRLRADGVNLISCAGAAAWQTVFHLHLHVLPRYEGDGLRTPWTPAPGDPAEIAAVARDLGAS